MENIKLIKIYENFQKMPKNANFPKFCQKWQKYAKINSRKILKIFQNSFFFLETIKFAKRFLKSVKNRKHFLETVKN